MMSAYQDVLGLIHIFIPKWIGSLFWHHIYIQSCTSHDWMLELNPVKLLVLKLKPPVCLESWQVSAHFCEVKTKCVSQNFYYITTLHLLTTYNPLLISKMPNVKRLFWDMRVINAPVKAGKINTYKMSRITFMVHSNMTHLRTQRE